MAGLVAVPVPVCIAVAQAIPMAARTGVTRAILTSAPCLIDAALKYGRSRFNFHQSVISVKTRTSKSKPATPAVVLLSGGLDSTTVLAVAQSEDFDVHALTFRYGQRHAREIDAARRIAKRAGVRDHRVIDIDLAAFGGSALTANIAVPKDRDLSSDSAGASDIPVTYVPARNTIFLSYAVALAEVIGASNIFIGVNALDYSGYPDCRPEYIESFEKMANLATRAGVEGATRLVIRAPLISLTKAAIIRLGSAFGVDYSQTTSCYDPGSNGEACGRCDACQLRLKGFREAGVEDPIHYAPQAAGRL